MALPFYSGVEACAIVSLLQDVPTRFHVRLASLKESTFPAAGGDGSPNPDRVM